MKLISGIILFIFALAFCIGANIAYASETTEAIDLGFTLVEMILSLSGISLVGIPLILLRASRATIKEILQSLDENQDVDNRHVLAHARNNNYQKAVKEFKKIEQ